ncbi:DUF3667 domain-containing protein [Flavobacterium lindanitolerans]|uniref:Uncharacterized protein DUF3667 n=1 Tax=Flavobacterium lindanitolerans TaxID=428988 RepID=A0A497UDB8_9FLAO|nr:DUF3667 domain-containing protein [Flavobacterium lindanitolerans]PKW30224.1 uncharacterized protein DUF3667 [Flavobacterium lindanitolerans]RLJ24564.1 uncharacterized protein DUF3667 [Flavobacterium lindanitolerans]
MGHQKLRENKTCLNCNYVVENKFCPNCGQENTETRQSFHYLFTHFIEDLTHYDGSFWKTIKGLLFKPGYLTKTYLEGKRKKFVPPVKLYIFISFVTFFLPTLLPGPSLIKFNEKKDVEKQEVKTTKEEVNKESEKGLKEMNDEVEEELSGIDLPNRPRIKNLTQLDSIQKNSQKAEKLSDFEYNATKKIIKILKSKNRAELWNKAMESFVHTLPKVLFLYMPIFAFFLWLMHDKKKWYYFDSGVFTLHYFSFLLLVITIGMLFNWIMDLIPYGSIFSNLYNLAAMFYMFFYFFRAHSNFFGEHKAISRLKGFVLFFINMLLISIFSTILFLYSLWNLH